MNWIKSFLGLVISLLFFLFLIEAGSYVILKYFEKNEIMQGGTTLVKNLLGQKDTKSKVVSNPYSLYWNNPDFLDKEYGKIYDSSGYRSKPIENYSVDAIRILALGGSTTNSWPYIKDNKNTWTSLTENYLSENLNDEFHVINAGLPYGTTAEILSHYLFKGKYLNPKYVIYHGGGNDMMPLFFTNYQTDYSHVRWTEAGIRMKNKILWIVDKSYFAKLFISLVAIYEPYNGNPPFSDLNSSEVLERVKNNDSIAFKENLEVLSIETKRNNSKLLLVSFLQAERDNLSRGRPDIVGFEDAYIIAVEKHNRIMKEISYKYKHVEFLKLDKFFFDPDWFIDNCHLNELGEAEKAKQISEFLAKMIR